MTASPSAGLDALAHLLGPKGFLAGDDRPARNDADASVAAPVRPLAVLRPADTAELSGALALCHEHGLPVTVQGGLSGLCGGATPAKGTLALSLERMVGIEEIDRQSMTMTVRAGTPIETVQKAAEDAGCYYGVDFGARGSATVGGTIATNAGGNRVLRYGMTRRQVIGLEAVLADGTVLSSLDRMLKNNAGFDLKQLFVGSEGQLGVVSRAVLALSPLPRWTGLALIATADYAAAEALLAAARERLGPQLSAFEVMWPDYWTMVTENVAGRRDPFADRHGLYVVLEAQGTDETADAPRFEAFLEESFEAGLVEDAMVAASLAEMAEFWAIRDASAEIEPTLGPHESFDIGLPPARIGAYVEACRKALSVALPESRAVFFGHAADGNIHVMASAPGGSAEMRHRVETVVYDLAGAYDGSISAEHGIGLIKRPWLDCSRSAEEIAVMRRLKAALDPASILNPGKLLPDIVPPLPGSEPPGPIHGHQP